MKQTKMSECLLVKFRILKCGISLDVFSLDDWSKIRFPRVVTVVRRAGKLERATFARDRFLKPTMISSLGLFDD